MSSQSERESTSIDTQGGAYIEQGVEIYSGDFVGRDKITTVKPLPPWQTAFWYFLKEHWPFVLVVIVMEIVLFVAYLQYKDLHVISMQSWSLVASIFAAGIWSLYAHRQRWRTHILFTITCNCVLVSLLGWQTWKIIYPVPFESDVFGVAFAALGDGPDFRQTDNARLIAQQVFEELCDAIQANQLEEDLCNSVPTASNRKIRTIRKIGVVNSSKVAEDYGRKIGAELVIWGQLTSENSIDIHFRILEILDQVTNPNFTVVLPVISTTSEILTHVDQNELNSRGDAKKVIPYQANAIAILMLAMNSYFNRDFLLSKQYFESFSQLIATTQWLDVSEQGLSVLYFYLGKTNQFIGNVEEGQNWLQQAENLNPREPAIPLSLAWGYQYLENDIGVNRSLDAASLAINNWLSVNSDRSGTAYAAAMYDRGLIHYLRGEFREQIEIYEELLKQNPSLYIAHLSLGEAYARIGNYKQAEQVLHEAIGIADQLGINSVEGHLGLAFALAQSNQTEQAANEYKIAISLAPDNYLSYYSYGTFLSERQDWTAAVDAFQTMARIAENSWAYVVLGNAQRKAEKPKDAISSFQYAAQKKADDFYAHFYLGQTYSDLNEFDSALNHYLIAQKIRPNHVLVNTYIAAVYAEAGESLRAIHYFEQAVKDLHAPDVEYALAHYADFLFDLGDYEVAAEKYEVALSIKPDLPIVLQNLASIYMFLEKTSQACDIYKLLETAKFDKELREDASEKLKKCTIP